MQGTASALSAVLSVMRVLCTLTMHLLHGRVLKLILIVTDVILSLKQNVLGCVFVRVCIQNLDGAKSAEMPSKTTNQHAAVPTVFYLFIQHRCLQHFLCPQYNTQGFSDRGRRNEKKTANSM